MSTVDRANTFSTSSIPRVNPLMSTVDRANKFRAGSSSRLDTLGILGRVPLRVAFDIYAFQKNGASSKPPVSPLPVMSTVDRGKKFSTCSIPRIPRSVDRANKFSTSSISRVNLVCLTRGGWAAASARAAGCFQVPNINSSTVLFRVVPSALRS